jgi:BACON domain-containing protein
MKNIDVKLQPFTVSSTPLNFGVVQQDSDKTLVISNPNNMPVIWHADKYKTRWLSLDEASSAGKLQPVGQAGSQQEIKVTVNASSMLAGSYTATLTFTAHVDEESASVQVPVLLTVPPANGTHLEIVQSPALSPSPLKAGLSFVRFLSSSQTLPLAISNWDSQNAVEWTADTYGTNWLTLDRYKGTLETYEQQELYVTANTNSLQLGDYAATLTLAKKNSKTPMHIQVELHVGSYPDGDNGPKAPIAMPNHLDLNSAQPIANPVTLQIINPPLQIGAVNLSIENLTPVPAWLTWEIVGQNTPLQPGAQRTINLTIDSSGLLPGLYEFDLMPSFSFVNPPILSSHSTPTRVPVNLTVN